MQKNRRLLLKSALATLAAGVSFVSSTIALAARPKEAFSAKSQSKAIEYLYGTGKVEPSSAVKLKIPDMAENGATVPVQVFAELENIESISIIVPKNPFPLAATFEHSPDVIGYASARIKMGESGEVIAAVKANGKVYIGKKKVKVTLGGCSG